MGHKFKSQTIKHRNLAAADSSADKNQSDSELADIYRDEDLNSIAKPPQRFASFVIVALLAALFGFGSSFAYNYYFLSPSSDIPEQKVFIDKQEDVTVTAEERLNDIKNRLNPVIVNFYNNSADVNGPFYQDIYSFGTGFILTSDGWIATAKQVMDNIGETGYVILTADYHKYEPETILYDPISPAVFIKINASNLPVAPLGAVSQSLSGQKVYGFIAAYPHPKVASLNLADTQNTTLADVVASTEKFSHFVSAREGYNISLVGSPIVNLSGEIIALVMNETNALPLEYLRTAISDLGKKDSIDRALFGVNYINLSKYPRVGGSVIYDHGALLSGFENLTAVIKGSPADKAGLKVGDIITAVENEIVNGKQTLTAMIQAYEPGTELKLTVLRGDKEMVINVRLAELD